MSRERAQKIKLILFDVDGVLTDGTIFLFPSPGAPAHATGAEREKVADQGGYAISSDSMVEAKGFNAHDGTAISLARLAGIKTGLVTKRISETVRLRARDLRVDHVHQGAADKSLILDEILREEGIRPEEVAYVGDDIIDLPIMRRCGLAIAVANARPQVLAEAHWVAPNAGGKGAARDAVEYVLEAQGKLQDAIEEYLTARSPVKRDP